MFLKYLGTSMSRLVLTFLFLSVLVSRPLEAQSHTWKRPSISGCTVVRSAADAVSPKELPDWRRNLTERILIIPDPRQPVEGWARPGACIDIAARGDNKVDIIMQKVVLARYPKLKCQTADQVVSAAEVLARPGDLKNYSKYEADQRYQFSLLLRSSCEDETPDPNSGKKSSACVTIDSKKQCFDN